jgi:hypothetical protein
MTCTDGCQYQAIGAFSIGRCNARLEHIVFLLDLVGSPYTSFHEFLNRLTSWTKIIQPLPPLPLLPVNRSTFLFNKFNKTSRGVSSVAAHVRAYVASTTSAAAVPTHKTTGIPDKAPSARETRAASRPLAGINEHFATSLLSLSFFQVRRFLQQGIRTKHP